MTYEEVMITILCISVFNTLLIFWVIRRQAVMTLLIGGALKKIFNKIK